VLYADPHTGAYLGIETILIEDSEELGLRAPAVIDFVALIEATWIDLGDLPPL
jgi:hypothetical protein